ncbi:MAG: glycosyltransferase, partial [Candidatus Dormibacteria bacterium]
MSDMAQEWQRDGHQVTVVTGMPNHPTGVVPAGYRRRLWKTERKDGIRILRSWLYASPNQAGAKKLLGHLSFALSSCLVSGPRLGGTDAVIISSPTFFAAFSAWLTARCRRAAFIFEVRDVWPEIFVDLGVLRPGRLLSVLQRMAR